MSVAEREVLAVETSRQQSVRRKIVLAIPCVMAEFAPRPCVESDEMSEQWRERVGVAVDA